MTTPDPKSIEVVCGANSQTIDLTSSKEKMTVESLRKQLGDILNIAPTAIAIIGDVEVEETHTVVGGDRLQFVKRSGSKG
jgi:hypothetical protein